ncbi:MAG: trimeric intracellular cation channel family protein [Verrucomicrobiota bacterium]
MTVITLIEFVAVIVAAIYGVLLAARKEMDVTGVFAVSFAVSFGGGTLRDLFLDRSPLFWIANPHYVVIVFVIAMAAGVVLRFVPRIKPLLVYPDALGMALFTMAGTGMALDQETGWVIAAIMGTITGTFGGVVGEIICNEVPTLFRPAPLNATCSFAGAWLFLILCHFDISRDISMMIGVVFILVFRILAVRKKWSLPPVREG